VAVKTSESHDGHAAEGYHESFLPLTVAFFHVSSFSAFFLFPSIFCRVHKA
jgi:hypothetical protein